MLAESSRKSEKLFSGVWAIPTECPISWTCVACRSYVAGGVCVVMLAPPVKEEKQEEVKESERSKEPARGNGARPADGAPRKPKTTAAKPAAGRARESNEPKTSPAGGVRQG